MAKRIRECCACGSFGAEKAGTPIPANRSRSFEGEILLQGVVVQLRSALPLSLSPNTVRAPTDIPSPPATGGIVPGNALPSAVRDAARDLALRLPGVTARHHLASGWRVRSLRSTLTPGKSLPRSVCWRQGTPAPLPPSANCRSRRPHRIRRSTRAERLGCCRCRRCRHELHDSNPSRVEYLANLPSQQSLSDH